MIREARHEDLPRLLEMGRKFVDYADLPFAASPEKVSEFARNAIEDDRFIFLVDDGLNSMICIFVYEHFLGALVAAEMFWWVEQEKRRDGIGAKLLSEAENRAAARGVNAMSMLDIKDDMGQFYDKSGYRFSERAYWKVM